MNYDLKSFPLVFARVISYHTVMHETLRRIAAQTVAKLPPETDAYRLCDGAPWRNIFIDALSNRLLVSTRDCPIPNDLLQELRSTGKTVYRKELERDNKQPPSLLCGEELSPCFPVSEWGVLYRLDMSAGYSQGLFLDQRENRHRVREYCRPGMKVLNTFAYTGAFSVCAALGGAETTTLDLAQPCLDWARENFHLNGIPPDQHYFCRGDALHWLDRFAKQGKRFDLIILDPPTFSRNDKGKIWRAERDYGELAAKAAQCLPPGGALLCTTNCRSLSHARFADMIVRALPKARTKTFPMPFDFSGEPYLKTIWCYF